MQLFLPCNEMPASGPRPLHCICVYQLNSDIIRNHMNKSERVRCSQQTAKGKAASQKTSRQDILHILDQFGKSSDPISATTDVMWDENTVVIEAPGQPDLTGSLWSDSISTTKSYSAEWQKLFAESNYLCTLRSHGLGGRLRSSRFRSVCWKLYLQVLPEDQSAWINRTREWRKKYDNLKEKLVVNPRNVEVQADLEVNNPLSQSMESPWNQYFKDDELRMTIQQDVIRTFPEIEFFKAPSLRETMIMVLFCFARHVGKLSYRQGMHELLAPIIFVLHCDHQAFLHASETESFGDILKEVLNPDYIEHDAFAMLCQIMETVGPWYVSNEIIPTARKTFSGQPFSRSPDLHPSNVIINKLARIQDYILKRFDPELCNQLQQMEIAPQIYGIRWLRLLFGREFAMQDLLVLWDAIFADGISFDLVDYIFVAMMMFLRETLLGSDYTSCLGVLMHYPAIGDVHYFIQRALYLREPNQYQRPPLYTHQTSLSPPENSYYRDGRSAGTTAGKNIVEKAATMMNGLSTLTRKLNRPTTLNSWSTQTAALSSSTVSPSSGRFNHLQKEDLSQENPKNHSSEAQRKLSSTSLSDVQGSSKWKRSSKQKGTVSADPSPPGPDRRFSGVFDASRKSSTLPSNYRSITNSAQPSSSPSPDVSTLMYRLDHVETMCQQCADKMDIHIKKLQSEMLRRSNEAEQEDELLVPLAGLKQVTVDHYKAVTKTNSLRNDRPSYQPSSVGAVDIFLSFGVPTFSLAMCRPPVVHCLTLSIQAVRIRPGLSFPRLRLRLMLKLWLRLFQCPCLDSFHRFSCAYSLQTHQPVVGSVFVN
ncbi:TBC1 domain family member 5 [Lamellibrachia satsuma]|nr:TBC1 domain family member 5 [Lamellibrachia satsuma]